MALGALAAVLAGGGPAPLHGQAPILTQLNAQQHSPGITWQQIVTPHFTVIFRDSLRQEAERAATLLERAYEPLTQSMGKKPERIPVLLAGESLLPNAFVSWFPRRTTWHPLPKVSPDFAGPVEWFNLLALHEGRHIAQERHMRSGIIGLAAAIFGDDATALLAGRLYFPSWLWEGDAVVTETAMTPAGRGRQPGFMKRVRAMRLGEQPYPHYPAWLGSYRTFYPGPYELGYLLAAHARRHHGADVWGRVIRRATRNPLTPYALSMALARETGSSLGTLHRAAVAEADSLWRKQVAAIEETPADVRTRGPDDYHLWHWPQYAGDGSIVTAYTDLSSITALVRLTRSGAREVLLRHFPARGEFPFHVAADRVLWVEPDVHPRWGELDHLTLKEFDLATRRLRTVRSGTRMYAVALSPDGARIAALDLDLSRRSRLLLLDAATGRTLQTMPNAEDHFLSSPAWSEDGSRVVLIATHRSRGNALLRIDTATGVADTLVPWTFDAMTRPVERGGHVYFGSGVSGVENIHAITLETRQQFQVTARRYGAYHADVKSTPEGATLLFRDYGPHGDEIAEMALTPETWRPVRRATVALPVDTLVRQESVQIAVDSAAQWEVRPYRGMGRIFDVHSLNVLPGSDLDPWVLQIFSRNVLNTVGSTLAYRVNPAYDTHALEAGVSYAGLFPIVDAGVRAGTDVSSYEDSTGASVPYTWRERAGTLTLRVPLTARRGLASQTLVTAATLGYTHISDQPVRLRLDNNNGVLTTLGYTLLAVHAEPAAYRDLVGTGVFLLARYRHTPLGGDYHGHTYLLHAGASVRGPLPHHGIIGVLALEEQRPTNYAFSSQFPFARGYEARTRGRLMRASASYALPLWYPDLSAGPLLFVRRIQGEVFGDYSVGYSSTGTNKTFYRSAGVELTADFVPLSMGQTWRAGVRRAYRADAPGGWRTQFIVRLP